MLECEAWGSLWPKSASLLNISVKSGCRVTASVQGNVRLGESRIPLACLHLVLHGAGGQWGGWEPAPQPCEPLWDEGVGNRAAGSHASEVGAEMFAFLGSGCCGPHPLVCHQQGSTRRCAVRWVARYVLSGNVGRKCQSYQTELWASH